jgi:hypothetical protein
MGRHVNQPTIEKKTAKRYDHRGELPPDYQDGIYQAYQQR